MNELDTFILVNLLEFTLGDETWSMIREEEEEGEIRIDSYFEEVQIIEKMNVAPATEETVPVETGHVFEGERIEVEEEEHALPAE